MRTLLVALAALALVSCADVTAPRSLQVDCTDVPDPACSDDYPPQKHFAQGGCYVILWRDANGVDHETFVCP